MREFIFSIIKLLTSTFFHTQFRMQLIVHRAEVSHVVYTCKNPGFTFTKNQEDERGTTYHKASFSFSSCIESTNGESFTNEPAKEWVWSYR